MANIVLEIIIRVVDDIYFFVHLAAKTERNFNGYVLKWCGIWNQSQDFKLMLSLQVRLGQTWEKWLGNIRFDVEWWILMIGYDFEVTWPLVN